jgi:NAD(P)-dependent dehydrogenase (short-subunit alcohol dehydrogenase family)
MTDEASGAKPLLDQVAIVTGSGQRIGRGVAMCLARAGAHVVIADQAAERIASVTAAVEDLGVQAIGVATDVSRATRLSGWLGRPSSVSARSTSW